MTIENRQSQTKLSKQFAQTGRGVILLYLVLPVLSFLLTLPAAAFNQTWRPLTQDHYLRIADVACPSKDFKTFLDKFVDDEAVQRAFTVFPLPYSEIDLSAEPEPQEVETLLTLEKAEFPLMPSKDERKEQSLVIDVVPQTAREYIVGITKPDTGYLVLY